MASCGPDLRDIARALRAQGLRVTPQRRLVLRLLTEQQGHLSADELYRLARRRQPRISLSTVYRALDTFEQLGLVRALHLESEHHRYEMAGDGQHHHIICLGCGQVIEFECGHCAEVHHGLAEHHGFQITGSQIQLLGYCTDCRARGGGGRNDHRRGQRQGWHRQDNSGCEPGAGCSVPATWRPSGKQEN